MEWPELSKAVAALSGPAEVIEVGTGRGALFSYLVDLLAAGRGNWRLITIDLARGPVDSATAKVRTMPGPVRNRLRAIQADVLRLAADPAYQSRFSLICASALLSAVPLARPWGVGDVLRACRDMLAPGGMLFLEDYLPLPPASQISAVPIAAPAGTPVAAAGPTGAADVARALWRWYKAVAELCGLPHYTEVPPGWLVARLGELGFDRVRVSMDERQEQRGGEELWEYLREPVSSPPALDERLWMALDRYRRDLLARTAASGLVQWSGAYRVSARRL